MHPRRRWPRLALLLLGGLEAIVGSAVVGDLFEGYGPGTYLLHVGAFALLLAGLPTVLVRTRLYPDPRGVVTAGLAFGGLYPLAVGLLWAGVVPSPYFPTAPSALGLAVDRLGFLLLLTPIAVGYVLGADTNGSAAARTRSRPRRRRRSSASGASGTRRLGRLQGWLPDLSSLAILVALSAPLIGYLIMVSGPGGVYIGPPFLLYWGALFAGVVVTIPFYLVARWGYGDSSDSGPFVGSRSDSAN